MKHKQNCPGGVYLQLHQLKIVTNDGQTGTAIESVQRKVDTDVHVEIRIYLRQKVMPI